MIHPASFWIIPTPPHDPMTPLLQSFIRACICAFIYQKVQQKHCAPDIGSSLDTSHSLLTSGFHTCSSLFLAHRSVFPSPHPPINSLLLGPQFSALMSPLPQSGSGGPLGLPQPPGPPSSPPPSLWVIGVCRQICVSHQTPHHGVPEHGAEPSGKCSVDIWVLKVPQACLHMSLTWHLNSMECT